MWPTKQPPSAALQQGFQFIAVGSEAGMMLSKAQDIASALGLTKSKAAVAKY